MPNPYLAAALAEQQESAEPTKKASAKTAEKKAASSAEKSDTAPSKEK